MQAEIAEKKKEDEVSKKFNRKFLKMFKVQTKFVRIVLFTQIRKISGSTLLISKF